jgi:altronate dehydratase
MDSSHIATGTITALLATVLVYLSHWPLQPLDLPTAAAFAGLLVAAGGAAVKFYTSRTAPVAEALAPVVSITSANARHEPTRGA